MGRSRGERRREPAAPEDFLPGVAANGSPAFAGPFMGPDPLPLLRAHGATHGSRVVHAGLEGTRWLGGPLRLGVALFVDGAVVRGDADHDLADAGVGLRLAVPGLATPLRIDHAWGRDGSSRWSAGLSFAPGARHRP